jgi:oligosaccharide repeat unit polymerase
MTVPQYFFFLLFLIIISVNIFQKLDPFSPAKIFLIIWAVIILIVEFKFSRLQKDWSLFSWFVLILGLFSFLVGNFISYTLNIGKKLNSVNEIRKYISTQDRYTLDRFYYAIVFLFLSYLVSFIAEVILFGTVPVLSSFPDEARSRFSVFGFALVVGLQPAIMFFCVQYLSLKVTKRKKKFSIYIIFIITLITYFLLLLRLNFFLLIIMVIVFLFYATYAINWKRVLVGMSLFTGLMIFLQTIRLSKYAAQFFYVVSKMKYSSEYASFTGPYMYISMNLENLAHGVNNIKKFTFGLLTFDWIMALTGIKHWATVYFNFDYREHVYSIYNTCPFLWDYYHDFGIVGVTVFPIVLGLIIGQVYYRMREKMEIEWIALYSFFVFMIILSFFTNVLTSLNMVTNLFVIYIIIKYFLNYAGNDAKKS